MENKLDLTQSWPAVKEKLQEANPELTDADLHYENGNEQALIDRLAAKMKREPEHIRGWIESVAFTDGKAS
ncbi:MAG: hypothetical protein JWQ27_215 [Ferruginibacter sp.]|nr:hypothetical protein [Ferruginibacter sp.]